MSQDIYSLLQKDDRGMEEATGLLSLFFRKILFDLGIDHKKWSRLIDVYYSPENHLAITNEKRLQNKSNTNDTLAKEAITTKAFVLGILILNPKKILYRIELKWDKNLTFTEDKPTSIEIESRSRKDPFCEMHMRILNKLKVTPSIWGRLVDRWLGYKEAWSKNPISWSNERGNINKGIMQKDIYTWSNFCKALSITGIEQCDLILNLHWANKKVTQHRITFKPLNQIIEESEDV